MDVQQALAGFSEATRDDLARLLMAASRAVNESALAAIDPDGSSGVRIAHVPVIAVLDADGTRIGDLAQRIGVTRQAAAQLTKDLEAAGIVAIAPDPTDRRAARVTLTDRGVQFCERATAIMRDREAAWEAEFGGESLARLKTDLRRLAP